MFQIIFEKQALKDLEQLKNANLSQKAKKLVDILRDNPYQNLPSGEKLVGNLEGLHFRRITIQHRLVYQVYQEPVIKDGVTYEGTIKIIRMWGHHGKAG
ncbi:MAG: Txe/YoeB family addiction module toxin [Lachnospiraceae bacterium]|jgi:toxin YoeB|nr:Txe/YoeB family addiction module toxin [Lachnospiraceae bacterium]